MSKMPEVVCRCSDSYLRVDLNVSGITYRGANVHGAGGLYAKGSLDRLKHRLATMDVPVRIYTKFTATDETSFVVQAGCVKVLEAT